ISQPGLQASWQEVFLLSWQCSLLLEEGSVAGPRQHLGQGREGAKRKITRSWREIVPCGCSLGGLPEDRYFSSRKLLPWYLPAPYRAAPDGVCDIGAAHELLPREQNSTTKAA